MTSAVKIFTLSVLYLNLIAISIAVYQDPLASLNTFELDKDFSYGTFPKDFVWASASAAYQIEGAWNASGKGVSIWDTLCHSNPDPIANNGTGDVACDSYHLWEKDIQLIKNLGTKYYRMSISWPRILPTGLIENGINFPGVIYYQKVIAGLLDNGIQPMITIYHWDLPQHLQDMDGWLNSSSPQWFLDYSKLCFSLFPQVKHWITFNEPLTFIWLGYGLGKFAPRISKCPGTCPYQVAHNVIKAHSMTWHAYDTQFRPQQQGKISITLNSDYCFPLTNSAADLAAADRCMQFGLGWFANPIYGNGDYPDVMKNLIANRSKAEGLKTSRLPSFTTAEIQRNKGTFDFFGLNHYSSIMVNNTDNANVMSKQYDSDQQIGSQVNSTWPNSGNGWLFFVPTGMRALLNWIRKEYANPPVIVTENGWADFTGTLNDTGRVKYYKYYINNVLKAYQDGCNVVGYTAWSLMDNLEWLAGYTQKFGIHYVNFSDPARPRTPKASARYFASIIANNGFTNINSSTTPAPLASTTQPCTCTTPTPSNVGKILGIVAAVVMVLLVIGALIFVFVIYPRHRRDKSFSINKGPETAPGVQYSR